MDVIIHSIQTIGDSKMSDEMSMDDLMAELSGDDESETISNPKAPIGEVNVKINGVTWLKFPIWKVSKSKSKFMRELNDAARDSDKQETYVRLAKLLFQKSEISFDMGDSGGDNTSLSDLLK